MILQPHKQLQFRALQPNTTAAIVNVILLQEDLDAIKQESNFGNPDSTFLAIPSGAVFDPFGNPLIGIPQDDPLNVSMAIIDQTPPELLEFSLDLDSGTIELSFNEVIDPDLVTVTSFILLDSTTPTTTYTLRSSLVDVMTNLTFTSVLNITLSGEDLNNLKSVPTLATSEADTYLRILFGAIIDTNFNAINTIPESSAIQASLVVSDTTEPRLVGFDLNLDLATITLTFTEALNTSSIDVTEIVLQNSLWIISAKLLPVPFRSVPFRSGFYTFPKNSLQS